MPVSPCRSRLFVCARFAAAVGAAIPLSAGAVLHVHEPFDYPAPSILHDTAATGFNLAGSYASTIGVESLRLRVSSPGLGYGTLSGAASTSGNKLTQLQSTSGDTVTVALAQPIDIPAGSAIYFSALFTLDDSLNGNHRAGIALADDASGGELTFGEATVGIRNIRATADTAATGGLLATSGSLGSFSDGQTLLLIGRYSNSAAALGDRLELLGYDTSASHPMPASFVAGDPNAVVSQTLDGVDIDLARISSLRFSIRGSDNNYIDELRIGSTLADVAPIPEPQAWLLMLCGFGAVLAGVRRRRVAPH